MADLIMILDLLISVSLIAGGYALRIKNGDDDITSDCAREWTVIGAAVFVAVMVTSFALPSLISGTACLAVYSALLFIQVTAAAISAVSVGKKA